MAIMVLKSPDALEVLPAVSVCRFGKLDAEATFNNISQFLTENCLGWAGIERWNVPFQKAIAEAIGAQIEDLQPDGITRSDYKKMPIVISKYPELGLNTLALVPLTRFNEGMPVFYTRTGILMITKEKETGIQVRTF